MVGGGTAAALVDAAEAGFARDGFEGASLRAVMRAAGADPGAVHYHFKGREGLAAAVLDRILDPLNGRRLELLAEAEERAGVGRGAQPVPLAELVEALIRPDLEVAADLDRRGSGRARLVAAMYLHPAAFVRAKVEAHFGPVAARFMPHLVIAVPHVEAEILAWRIRWCVFGTVGALLSDEHGPDVGLAGDVGADHGRPDDLERRDFGLDRLVRLVIPPMTAALAAPDENRNPEMTEIQR